MKEAANNRIPFRDSYTFHLKERLNHELFWWPETLLTYPFDFSADTVTADSLTLEDPDTGEELPCQLSNVRNDRHGKLLSADVSLMSGLGSGEERRYTLKKASQKRAWPAIGIAANENGYRIDNGKLVVQIPGSRLFPVEVPGPIMGIESGGRRFGASRIELGSLRILEMTTRCLASGSLFAEFSVKYTFDGGKSYEFLMKFIRNMEFVECTERIEGISEQDGASFELHWSGFAPTHRHAPNNPPIMMGSFDTPYDAFNWQRIDEAAVGGYTHPTGMWSNGKDGQIPFRLSLYEPQSAIVKVNSAAFWDEYTGQSVGAFMIDEAAWDHGNYDLFCSWDGFAVSFFYRNGLLWWKYPLTSGTRATALAVYDHEKDGQYFDSIRPLAPLEPKYLAGGTKANFHGVSYCTFLQARYSLLSLQRIKDFVLEYPESAERGEIASGDCPYADADSFETFMTNYILVSRLPTHGAREHAGFSPVPYRRMVSFAIAYGRYKDDLPPERRKRIEALLLLLTYLAAGEQVVPLLRMLGGPPNLQGDVRRALGYMATLFPEHPEAGCWKEIFAKFVETSLRLFTRPDLKGLRLEGGRWAENIGTYTWAFLVPALQTASLLEGRAGMRNLFASRHAALLGKWLVHGTTAPFRGENEQTMALMGDDRHYWGCFAEGDGPHRVYPPIGAHAARRRPPVSLRDFAKRLERYDPVLAENIRYLCVGLADDFEARKKESARSVTEQKRRRHGTRPEFRTMAFTGFGVMLRSGVYTPDEVSVLVQQIDEGPNYRWGTAGMGGNGNLYYYANGRAYSHNGKEDAGDRRLNDCEVGCNFGVWKQNRFVSIGPNVLTNGYHALGVFQYTAIESERDDQSYSYPEYVERNVLLSGTDYISIYDKTGTPAIRHRFTWSVSAYDPMPCIHMVSDYSFRSRLTTGGKGSRVEAVWYEGDGDGFAVVTHREDVQVEKRSYGAAVTAADFKDTLLRSQFPLKGEFDGVTFTGTAGAVREYPNGEVEVSLLAGYEIGARGVRLASANGKTGLSLRRQATGELAGRLSALHEDRIRVSCDGDATAGLYIQSVRQEPDGDGWYRVRPGEYTLQLVAAGDTPTPAKPVIANVVQGDGMCEAIFRKAPGAERYEVQISEDFGETWFVAAETGEKSCIVDGLTNGRKYGVRVRGLNGSKRGEWSHEYPVYPSAEKPLPPEGEDVVVRGEKLDISWGKVLGARSYRLYRTGPHGGTELLYEGEENDFSCRRSAEGVSRYTVSSVNLCGEGETSPFEADDDPDSLRNYKPGIDRFFDRNSQYNHHPFALGNPHKFRDVPSSYPESARQSLDDLAYEGG